MPAITFSEKHLKATEQVKADWYILECVEISPDWQSSTRTPGARNIVADFEIKDGPGFKDVPVRHFFSEKVLGTNNDLLVPFFRTLTENAGGKFESGKPYNPSDAKGKKVRAWVEYEASGGFPGNKIRMFEPNKKP